MIYSLLVLLKLFGDSSDLSPHMKRIHVVEDWNHGEGALFDGIHDLDEFFETPSGRCVILGDHNDGKFRLFDGACELQRNHPTTLKLHVVFEGTYLFSNKFFVEKADNVAASVDSSETQKDVVVPEGGSCCNIRHLNAFPQES